MLFVKFTIYVYSIARRFSINMAAALLIIKNMMLSWSSRNITWAGLDSTFLPRRFCSSKLRDR